MSQKQWMLKIYQSGGEGDRIATMEFATLPLLRIAIAENRGKKFTVEPPAHATAADRITLLDLRAQGFDIAVRSDADTRLRARAIAASSSSSSQTNTSGGRTMCLASIK
jgi:hypothetical protein